jgi:hypothetical protein
MPQERSRGSKVLELNVTYQLLTYADNVKIVGDKINTMKNKEPSSGMRGTILPFPQYAFMAWCSVRKTQTQIYFYLYLFTSTIISTRDEIKLISSIHILTFKTFLYEHKSFILRCLST